VADSKTNTNTSTEDSRVVATDEGFAVGRGSDVVVYKTDGEAFKTVVSMSEILGDVVGDVAGDAINNARVSEARAYDLAEQTLTQTQSDIKEIADTIVKKGVPLAIAAWAATRIWGSK
jgi:hypothetical protein